MDREVEANDLLILKYKLLWVFVVGGLLLCSARVVIFISNRNVTQRTRGRAMPYNVGNVLDVTRNPDRKVTQRKSNPARPYVVGNAFWNRGVYADGNLSYMNSFSGSIMLEYSMSMRKAYDISVLADIIERRRDNTTKAHGTVIHLRMGDDIVEDTCWERQCIFNKGDQNPLSKPAYENLSIPSFDSVYLIGSYNGGGSFSNEKKSIAYAMQVEHYLSRDVVVKSHFTAFTPNDYKYVDADLVDATHTSQFVCSGGTFSFTLAAVVLYNGGKIYNCKYQVSFF
jgi:hypothetical protein